jgi:hypothetical protein
MRETVLISVSGGMGMNFVNFGKTRKARTSLNMR